MNKDMRFLIECTSRDIIRLLVEDYGVSRDEAMDMLFTSNTYKILENKDSGLYYQSPYYVYELLQKEISDFYIPKNYEIEHTTNDIVAESD